MTAATRNHNRDSSRYCGGKKRQGEGTCTRPAGWGTPHPGTGRCKLHGGSLPGSVKGARRIQAEQAVAAYGLPVDVDPMVAILQEVARTNGHVLWLHRLIGAMDADSLVGDGSISPWLELYQRERRHLAAVSRDARSLGIEQTKLDLIVSYQTGVVDLLERVLRDLGHDPDTPEVSRVVLAHLEQVAGQAAGLSV